MAVSILVAFATKYGSTKEAAVAVADRLQERGVPVEIKPVRDVRSLDGYAAVVLAAPYYLGSMLKEARAFLERHRGALERTPLAVMAFGPLSADEDIAEARKQLDRTFETYPGLDPVAAEMFVGKFDPAALKGTDKLVASLPASPLRGQPPRDDRDWDAIRAFADRLPLMLQVHA